MVNQHFGFSKDLFPADITGADVFVGPQTATTIAGLKKALLAHDAISTVSGPVGSGKTTLVRRAVESIGERRIAVQVARMRLSGADVLDLLLEELGLRRLPSGTIQKFSIFRKRLKELQDAGTRIVVIVEDAPRLSADTIAELEALTAADAGESNGANVVLMGDEHLHDFLQEPLLARLRQRIRHRHEIGPLCEAELLGYLRHCFRLVSSDFGKLFPENTSEILYDLSGGIPRMANNIVASTLRSVAAKNLGQASPNLIADIAAEEYALYCPARDTDQSDDAPTTFADADANSTPALTAAPEPTAEPELSLYPASVEATRISVDRPETDDPDIVLAAENQGSDAALEIPELIQDTLPNLAILAPELTNIETEEPSSQTLGHVETELPVLVDASASVPQSDRDPTLAELKPDLAVLEEAMSIATETDDVKEPVSEDKPNPEPTDVAEAVSLVPEITLDNAINKRIDSRSDDPRSPTQHAVPVIDQAKKADTAIQRIAAGLAKAKSIEDVDDKMAETLFGGELDLIAADFLPPATDAEPANDEIAPPATAATAMIADEVQTKEVQANEDQDSIEVTLQDEFHTDKTGLDLYASQRLRTVRALNADRQPVIRERQAQTEIPGADEPPPESIEDQINTSITQTVKALSMPVAELDDSMEQERPGFFSRFKRS